MYYDNEYTERDAQIDMDAYEDASEPFINDFEWTDAARAESEKYLMIGGAFADDAGPIGMESQIEMDIRSGYAKYEGPDPDAETLKLITSRYSRGSSRIRKAA
jgi:hypothetical protein